MRINADGVSAWIGRVRPFRNTRKYDLIYDYGC
jgi:hypothetical protein